MGLGAVRDVAWHHRASFFFRLFLRRPNFTCILPVDRSVRLLDYFRLPQAFASAGGTKGVAAVSGGIFIKRKRADGSALASELVGQEAFRVRYRLPETRWEYRVSHGARAKCRCG